MIHHLLITLIKDVNSLESKQNLIRQGNLATLSQLLFKQGSALKAEMATATKMSVVTINALIKELLEEGIVTEGLPVQQSLGRPALNYHFNYNQSYYLLLSIQADLTLTPQKLIILAKIVNLAGEEAYAKTFDYSEVTLSRLLEIIQLTLEQPLTIAKIALALPGKVANDLVQSSYADLFNGWNIAAELKKVTDIPLSIQNDAHLLTMGSLIKQQIKATGPIVGIFYPEKSMPGITIAANGRIFEGVNGLAGEAKYLPSLIDRPVPNHGLELKANLLEIIAIYNAVIVPEIFLISSDSLEEAEIMETIASSPLLNKQPNKPRFQMIGDFQDTLTFGLRWLASLDTLYLLS